MNVHTTEQLVSAELATVVEVCYLIGNHHFKSMRFAQAQEHIRNCLAFLIGFGLFPSRRNTSSAVASAVESGAALPTSAAPLVADEAVSAEEVPPFADRWSLALVFNAWATFALSTSDLIDGLLNLVRLHILYK